MEGLKKVFPFCTSRIASDRLWEEVCLSRKPTAPTAIAWSTYASSLCAERMTTLVSGKALRSFGDALVHDASSVTATAYSTKHQSHGRESISPKWRTSTRSRKMAHEDVVTCPR